MKIGLLIIIGIMMTVIGFTSSTFAQELPPCTSDRVACQNPPICENTMWDCPDNSDIFSIITESENTFIIDGYAIITNSDKVSNIEMDWLSEHLPELSVNFTKPFTGQLEIQVPKNMPRMMNLDFETGLVMDVSSLSGEDMEKNWNEHITEVHFKLIDDRVTETVSLCYYTITVELEESEYFKLVTYTVASGRWEPVIIENDSCDMVYDGKLVALEPEEPTISDEQLQMMREYCETGIRHPDMMGIPQCIKEPDWQKGECERDAYGNFYGCLPQYDPWKKLFSSPGLMLVVFGTLGLVIGIPIIVIYVWRKRK